MKNSKFINGEIYHIYNRGVEKRSIVMDDSDRLRFIHCLYEFNDIKPSPPINLHFKKEQLNLLNQTLEVRLPKFGLKTKEMREPRKLLVEIMVFCIMDNHYHLMVRQLVEGGITLLMRKLGSGYTNYFNLKYERVGGLFQGRFKSVHLINEDHFNYLPHYMHLNPLDLIGEPWRDNQIKDYKNSLKFLSEYRWSSYMDYIGIKNFPSITQRKFLLNVYGGTKEYQESIKDFMKGIDFNSFKYVALD